MKPNSASELDLQGLVDLLHQAFPRKAKAGLLPGLLCGPALCGASVFASMARNVRFDGVACFSKGGPPSPWARGLNQESQDHLGSLTLTRRSQSWHPCQRRAALTPRARFMLMQRLPAMRLS